MNNTTAIVSLAALAGAAWFFTRPEVGGMEETSKRAGAGSWAKPETFPYTTQEYHKELLPDGYEDLLSFSIWRREFETSDGPQKAFKIHVGPRGKQFSVRMEGGAMASPAVSIANKALPHAVFPGPGEALDAVAAYLDQYQDELAALDG
jgi:hypothetical protein